MKKVAAIILCFVLCVSIIGCDSSPIAGTWKYSINGITSVVKFKGDNTVVWSIEKNGDKNTIEGTYVYDAEREEVTVTLPGFGTDTYDVSLSIPQIDFMNLPHRKK